MRGDREWPLRCEIALLHRRERAWLSGHGAVLDIVEVGAGGGSIAWLDEQDRLHVGPRSAGSAPGPVCYGRGGTEPTITDANLVLGRLIAASFLGGEMQLDDDAARSAIETRVARPLGFSGAAGLTRRRREFLRSVR